MAELTVPSQENEAPQRLDIVLSIEDRTNGSKEEFHIAPDDALLLRTFLFRIM